MKELIYLHSRTCVAELWHEAIGDRPALLKDICFAAVKPLAAGARVNLALPNRDGWVAAACAARDAGAPIHWIVTNAPAGTFPQPDVDSFFVNAQRQANFLRNILRDAEYLMAPETAGVFCALQSHRIARAEPTPSVIAALCDPMAEAAELCGILGRPASDLPMLGQGRKRFMEFG